MNMYAEIVGLMLHIDSKYQSMTFVVFVAQLTLVANGRPMVSVGIGHPGL